MSKKYLLVSQTIHKAIDSYPGGLCFAMPDGRPILVNFQMNDLCLQLVGHTVLDAEALWDELCLLRANTEAKSELTFQLSDGKVWRFRRESLTDGCLSYTQIEASDITELHRRREKLTENNRKLREQTQRQRALLANIVQTNRDKELLSAKMRVHDELGRCILSTRKALSAHTLSENALTISQAWENAVRDFSNIPLDETGPEVSPREELLKVAEMIGCKIVMTGVPPAERSAELLFYAAIREALTNAVRHAGANQLFVSCEPLERCYHIELSDNGTSRVSNLREGSGLSGLRQRLERAGATMDILWDGGVKLLIDLPRAGIREEEPL